MSTTELPEDLARLVNQVLEGFDFAAVASLFEVFGHTYGGPAPTPEETQYQEITYGIRLPFHVPNEAELRAAARELLERAVQLDNGVVDSGRFAAVKTGSRLALWYCPIIREEHLAPRDTDR